MTPNENCPQHKGITSTENMTKKDWQKFIKQSKQLYKENNNGENPPIGVIVPLRSERTYKRNCQISRNDRRAD